MRFLVVKAKTIKYVIAIMIVIAMLTINFGSGPYANVFFGYVPRKVPIYSVETNKKQVAISFDSAWGADKTLGILKTLKEFNCNATFFLVGFWVEDYTDMVKAIKEQGVEIGTHSNTHPDFVKLSEADMRLELTTSMNLIKNITGDDVKLFRAPYGSYNNTVLSTASSLGLTTIQWDVDTLDWKGLSAMEITNRVINKVKNGSIILCHNNSDHILDALPILLDRLIKMGYEITSVGDLIIKENYYVDNLGIQRKQS